MSPDHVTTHPDQPLAARPAAAPPPPGQHAYTLGEAHAGHVAHHFRDMSQQHEAGMLGMWMFLGTEVLFFGGILTAFTVYRWKYPEAFTHGSMLLYYSIGTANTVVLLCSSLTMAMAVRAAKLGQSRRVLQAFLAATFALGLAFLVVKGVEYTLDYREHLIPNLDFHPKTGEGADEWPPSLDLNHGQIFFSFYFVLTAIHGVHMLIGLALVVILIVLAGRGRYGPAHYTPVEAMGLYWHFVDIVWVFLYPLLYLIR